MTSKLHLYTVNAQGGICGISWIDVPAGGSGAWGAISGTLSAQTDLQAALDGKQKTITISGTPPGNPSVNDLWLAT